MNIQENDSNVMQTMSDLRCSLSLVQATVLQVKDAITHQFMMTRFYKRSGTGNASSGWFKQLFEDAQFRTHGHLG